MTERERVKTLLIGKRENIGLGNFIFGEGKEERGSGDLCIFIDIQYGEEDIERFKEELRKRGLEFDDVIVFCG